MNAFGKLDLDGVGMHTDDYRRGYIQGNRDGGPARVRDLLLGGPLALILLGLPFGRLFLLFWLDEHYLRFMPSWGYSIVWQDSRVRIREAYLN